MNRLLTFCVSVPKDVVVFHATPTLLFGLTVKASESCNAGRLRELAPCPTEPIEENTAKSNRPDARGRAVPRFGTFIIAGKRGSEGRLLSVMQPVAVIPD